MEGSSFPPYAFVPGGPWPHPNRRREAGEVPEVIADPLGRGVELFDAGYYWEAHEAWEVGWHAEGRRGPAADFLKGLIKLAAAGVKVREGQPRGVVTHARRAAEVFRRAGDEGHPASCLDALIVVAEGIAASPPSDPGEAGSRVSRVFGFGLRELLGVRPASGQERANRTVVATPHPNPPPQGGKGSD